MAGKERSVLIVDDDPSVLYSLRLLLESGGYANAGFGSAEELLESGLVESACCLILDIKLSGMSGFGLQEVLAASQILIPVVFITGHDRPGMEEQAMKLGAIAYLRKPFEGQTILDVIQSCHGKGNGWTRP
jgi:FixJ family two-component response regulator